MGVVTLLDEIERESALGREQARREINRQVLPHGPLPKLTLRRKLRWAWTDATASVRRRLAHAIYAFRDEDF